MYIKVTNDKMKIFFLLNKSSDYIPVNMERHLTFNTSVLYWKWNLQPFTKRIPLKSYRKKKTNLLKKKSSSLFIAERNLIKYLLEFLMTASKSEFVLRWEHRCDSHTPQNKKNSSKQHNISSQCRDTERVLNHPLLISNSTCYYIGNISWSLKFRYYTVLVIINN